MSYQRNFKLVNIPSYLFHNLKVDQFNYIQKIFFLLRAKLIIFILDKFNKQLLCSLINSICYSKEKIKYDSPNYYIEKYNNKIFYPKDRLNRIFIGFDKRLNIIAETYGLNKVSFQKGDIFLDCGANIGEVYFAISKIEKNIDYIAFEPDRETFKFLQKNCDNKKNVILNNFALSSDNGTSELFIDSEGANSSLLNFGTNKKIKVSTKRLDSINFAKNIKFLKIDAEGFEPEVLHGTKQIFDMIEFISVDYGQERGLSQESTVVSVLNFLYQNNFELIYQSEIRPVGLFKNKKVKN